MLAKLADKMAADAEAEETPDTEQDAEENNHIPAGYTYLGQFIDHDLTFDPNSSLQKQNDLEALVDFRTPRFDLDCVYGRVEKWGTDDFLDGLDIWSNHDDYICGPWTLYRNVPKVNGLFLLTEEWSLTMTATNPTGWAEFGFTAIVDHQHELGNIRRRYTKFQTRSQDDFSGLRLLPDGRLMDGRDEAMMCHFRRTKVYPEGCIL